MTVFKGFLLITKRNIHMMFLYIAIFLTIAIAAQKMTGGNQSGFKQESLNIAEDLPIILRSTTRW